MLVLSRKEGETIRIGDDIEITVVRISGNRVRIGISAPKEVSVTRPHDKKPKDAENKPKGPLPLSSHVYRLVNDSSTAVA